MDKKEGKKNHEKGMKRKQLRDIKTAEKFLEKIKRKDKEEKVRKINESRYDSDYKEIRLERVSKYLEDQKKRRDTRLIIRFRCENKGESTLERGRGTM